MKNNSDKIGKTVFLLGIILISTGVIFNKWTLTALLSPDGVIKFSNIVIIWCFDAICIYSGYLCIKYKTGVFKEILNSYRYFATLIFTVCLLFAGLNVCLYVFTELNYLKSSKSNPVSMKYGLSLKDVYPEWDEKSINKLLNETWSRPYIFETYTQFKERPFNGKYVNVDKNGFRLVKNQGPFPPDKNNYNIFVFGGSTSFGYGVPDDQTIPSYLQELFRKNNRRKQIFVYNFARGGYFSSQERILYEKLLVSGLIPNTAVFIDGLNDFASYDDSPLYSDKFSLMVEGDKKHILADLPLVKYAVTIKMKQKNFRNTDSGTEEQYKNSGILTSVINRYLANKKLIEAVSAKFDVKPVFVWQPIPSYKYDLKYHIFSVGKFGYHTYSKYGYPVMERRYKKGECGGNFLWLADIQENVKKPLYVDQFHYSAEMSKIIAEDILNFMERKLK